MTPLWHYTCDHGYKGLGERGELISLAAQISPDRYAYGQSVLGEAKGLMEMIWLTDLEHPNPDGLGLTRHILGCNRAAYRYRVLNPEEPTIHRYFALRRSHFTPTTRILLESAPGALPAHWWVALAPVKVAFDPIK